jgi:hypothetical protein
LPTDRNPDLQYVGSGSAAPYEQCLAGDLDLEEKKLSENLVHIYLHNFLSYNFSKLSVIPATRCLL